MEKEGWRGLEIRATREGGCWGLDKREREGGKVREREGRNVWVCGCVCVCV